MNELTPIKNAIPNPIVTISESTAKEIEQVLADATAVQKVDARNFQSTNTLFTVVDSLAKTVEKERKAAKAPVLALGDSIDEAVRPYAIRLAKAKNTLGVLINDFRLAQQAEEQQRRHAAAAAAAEAAKLAAAQKAQPLELDFAADTMVAKAKATAEKLALAVPDTTPKPTATMRTIQKLVIEDESKIPFTIGTIRLWTVNRVVVEQLLREGVPVPGASLVGDQIVAKSR
jgi:hypothetical protein